jgi:hypothetical protein
MCLARERDGRRGALGGYLDAPVLRLGGAGPLDLWANQPAAEVRVETCIAYA